MSAGGRAVERLTRRGRPLRVAVALFCAAPLFPEVGEASTRARYGGALQIAAVSAAGAWGEPLLADTPVEATLSLLVRSALCRSSLAAPGAPAMVTLLRRGPAELSLRVNGVSASLVAETLTRVAASRSPYRALLAPLRSGEKGVTLNGPTEVDLALEYPFPDFESALCHPALAPLDEARSLGPFRSTAERHRFVAQPLHPGGRPFLDRLGVTFAEPRAAQRLAQQGRVQLVLGGPEGTSAPQALYATYLSVRRGRVGEAFRGVVEGVLDRADLTRYFVRAPAQPMDRLLPPGLLSGAPLPVRPFPPAASAPARREVTLLYDASRDDLRAVAERLQVKLAGREVQVSLQGLPRAQLRERARSGDYDLMLQSILLPPAPAAALALVLDLAERPELLARHLPALGAVVDAEARGVRVAELAAQLQPTLDLIPLYAEGLRVRVTEKVSGLKLDLQGLPRLDELFLAEP